MANDGLGTVPMPNLPTCRHCGDTLADDSPPDLTSCRAYCNWRARQAGDMLGEEEAIALRLLRFYCEWDAAIQRGLELIPELEP
jgi:hypothetical protein